MSRRKRLNSGRKIFNGKSVKDVLSKLEYMFGLDSTDREACMYAGISPAALYRYEQLNPEFRERKGLIKTRLTLLARKTIWKGIEGNPELAFKYLERKCPEEFGRKEVQVMYKTVYVTPDGKIIEK